MKTTTIGFLGCGGIGCGVWDLLEKMKEDIAHREGQRIEVRRILVRDMDKPRGAAIPRALLTTDPRDVLDDPAISVVLEFMGGELPALDYLCRALENGKTVVTANKMAVAMGWHKLFAAAKRGGAGLYFEAAVCGAIPIIATLSRSLQGNRVDALMGIVNGTTNYILSQMTETGRGYQEVLAEAQALGLAEPDPASDVQGFDAAYKLSVLSSLAFHARIPYACIHREGIDGIAAQDIAYARELGYTVKLLAIAKREAGSIDVRVHPCLVPHKHPLASVHGAFNAIFLHGSAAGDLMLYGQGAGAEPTAGAVVSDLLYAVQQQVCRLPSFEHPENLPSGLSIQDNWRCPFYLRFEALNRPGVLGHITTCLGQHEVSIESVVQRHTAGVERVPVVLLTQQAREKSLRQALTAIDPNIAQVKGLLRIEGQETQ
jgi:homoserine dehydrogenase